MEKVLFILPENSNVTNDNKNKSISFNTTSTENSIINSSENSIISSSNTKINERKNNIEPVKILENIYTFENNDNNTIDESSIASLYSKGLRLKAQKNIKEAISVFLECLKKNEDKSNQEIINIYYEVYINLGLLTPQINKNFELIRDYYTSAFTLCPDRAEPYYYFSIYCNLIKKYDVTYDILKTAINISYDKSQKKYKTVQYTAYGKYLYFELGIACCELKKYDEGLEFLNIIKIHPEFSFMREIIKEKIDFYEIKKKQKIIVNNEYPTLCFISMCKNEQHVIKQTLESVYKYIDYWIICDTGSTDNTCQIIKDFFAEKNIPGELYIDEWKGFDVNKSLMFERAYGLTDYVLHLDADDWLCGDFDKELLKTANGDAFHLNYKRGSSTFITTSIYNNRLRWKYAGVAHNIIVCLDNKNYNISHHFVSDKFWVDNNERGNRMMDPKKYLKDAEILSKQFFDTLYEDPYGLVNRSVFYTAQSYFDYKDFTNAFKWYNLYTKLKDTWIEEVFESRLRLMQCRIHLNHDETKIKNEFEIAISIFNDRAEPYVIIGNYYFNTRQHDKSYIYFSAAKKFDYTSVKNKYKLFINKYSYGKYINDHLSVSCSYIDKKLEGRKLIEEIIDDPEFAHNKERFEKNLEFM